ncbi:MAG: hypothetical protein HWN68_17310 [Desulfobacterales bacterium]|nr:hypothetical protein [Desulfobacterales bacterium]
MRRKRKRNRFTLDEAQTATLINTEGTVFCHRYDKLRYPTVEIKMCDRDALKPAERVFGTVIYPARRKRIECPPEYFPPHGRGSWAIRSTGKKAKKTMKRLKPLLSKRRKKRWKKIVKECR